MLPTQFYGRYEMRLVLTAVFHEDEEGGYVTRVLEIPGAISQGDTLEEARANLEDAVRLLIETSETMVEGRNRRKTGDLRAAPHR